MDDFVKELETDINRQVPLPSKVLLSRFCFLSDNATATQVAADPKYFPFFYYLGKKVQSKRLLEISFGLGLVSGCFLQGCKTVQEFVSFQDNRDEFYSFRLGRKNIFFVYKNKFNFIDNILDLHGEFDCSIMNDDNYPLDDYRAILDTVWTHLAYGGLMVIDHAKYGTGVCKKVLPDFVKIANREPVFVNTRYGTVLIKK